MLAGCAGKSVVTRDQFMARAGQFDARMQGQEQSMEYRICYGKFYVGLLADCKPLLKYDGVDTAYWTCADEKLDEFEQCMEGGSDA